MPHFAGAPNQLTDEIVDTQGFSDVSIKIDYSLPLKGLKSKLAIFGGVKNVFNAYQSDFDLGKNRDSNYVYGPGLPRTYFVGVAWSSQ